ncbi:MAG: alpha/beta hydrolase [Candidatus Hodarchaeales archaeon]|jgi:fermentation-respiration switch protein FrsA (DUF1100 family)
MNQGEITRVIWILLSFGLFLIISSGVVNFSVVADVHIEEIQLNNRGTILSALFLYREPISSPKPAIVVYHGWGSSKEVALPGAIELARAGFAVLVPDLRGHGESQGVFELGLIEKNDAQIAIDYLINRPEVDPESIAISGSSFGGAISLLAAGIDPRIKAAIAASTPSNMTTWLKERDFRVTERMSYRPHVEVDYSNKSAMNERSPVTWIKNITNLLLIHGIQDVLVPIHHAHDLHRASTASNKKLILLDEGHDIDPARAFSETLEFLDNIFPAGEIQVASISASYYILMGTSGAYLIGMVLTTLALLTTYPSFRRKISHFFPTYVPEWSLPLEFGRMKLIVLLSLATVFTHVISSTILLLLSSSITFPFTFGINVLVTICLITVTVIWLSRKSRSSFSVPRNQIYKSRKSKYLEIGFSMLLASVIFLCWTIVSEFVRVPFSSTYINIQRVNILILISVVQGIECFFFWELIYKLLQAPSKQENWFSSVSRNTAVYLFIKLTVFINMIIFWGLLEIRLIILSSVLFGLIGTCNSLLREKSGFFPTLIMSIAFGLILYSSYSIFFIQL